MQVEEAGCPEGTTICVRDLFYNTPARLKFMKKDSAEGAAVAGMVQHLALSHPEVSFKLLRDGAGGAPYPRRRAAAVRRLRRPGPGFCPEAAAGGRPAAATCAVSRLCDPAPSTAAAPGAAQLFFVNGRFVKSQLLTAALEEAYRNQLLKGKFPGCVLHLTLPVDRGGRERAPGQDRGEIRIRQNASSTRCTTP